MESSMFKKKLLNIFKKNKNKNNFLYLRKSGYIGEITHYSAVGDSSR